MNEQDVKLNDKRVRFSKKIKRKILLDIAKGEKAKDVFLKHAFESFDEITTDKKYASKLLYKWKKELYQNKEILNLLNHEIDNTTIKEEIKNIGHDSDESILINEEFLEINNKILKMIQ